MFPFVCRRITLELLLCSKKTQDDRRSYIPHLLKNCYLGMNFLIWRSIKHFLFFRLFSSPFFVFIFYFGRLKLICSKKVFGFFYFLVCWVDMTWNVCHVNKWKTFPWLGSYRVTRDKSSLQRKELTRMCCRHIATSRNRSLFQQNPLLKWKLRPIGVERKLIRMCREKSV